MQGLEDQLQLERLEDRGGSAAEVHAVGRSTTHRGWHRADLRAQRPAKRGEIPTTPRHQIKIAITATDGAVRDVDVQADHTFSTISSGIQPLRAFGRLT